MSSHSRIPKPVQSLVTFVPNIIAPCLLPRTTQTDDPSESLEFTMGAPSAHRQEGFDGLRGLLGQATIDKLTDDALLEVFDFYLDKGNPYGLGNADKWHTLVHVCRRWRNVVFASPRRLNLRLLCRKDRPVRAMLDIWPALLIEVRNDWKRTWKAGLDNIIAAIEHPDRVCSIDLNAIPGRALDALAAEMQVPFPELTYLELWSYDGSSPVLPDSFLGGSAPRLRTLQLSGIPFPAAPHLLLSARNLVDLALWSIPHAGYISPESMAACLSALSKLETLSLDFQSRLSRPDQPSPPPQTRVVLPALSYLGVDGTSKYLEDLVARIDTPVLSRLYMSFFRDAVFDIPHFRQFIGRAKGLKLYEEAKVVFDLSSIRLELDQPHGSTLRILSDRIDWQISSMASVCGELSPFFSHIKRLDLVPIYSRFYPQGEGDVESTQLLDLVRPFPAIQSLYVSERLVSLTAPALRQLVGEKTTVVLLNLRDLFLGGSAISEATQDAIQPLLAARRSSSKPIAVHLWEEGSADW